MLELLWLEKTIDRIFFVVDLLRARLLLADVIWLASTIIYLSASFRKRIQSEIAKIGAHLFRLSLLSFS